MIDKDEYPKTAEMESAAFQILADLWHAPECMRTRPGLHPPQGPARRACGGMGCVEHARAEAGAR